MYDLGIDSAEHQYVLANGLCVSNCWSNPADAVRYMVMAKLHSGLSSFEASGGGRGAKLVSGGRRSSSNVVDGMAI